MNDSHAKQTNDGIIDIDANGNPIVGDFKSAYQALIRNDENSFLSHVAKLESMALTRQTPDGATLLHLLCKSTLSDRAFFALLNKQPDGFRSEYQGNDQAATAFLNKKINWQMAIKLKEKMPNLTFQL